MPFTCKNSTKRFDFNVITRDGLFHRRIHYYGLNVGFVSYKHAAFHNTLIDGLELCVLLVDYSFDPLFGLILMAPIDCR